MVPPLNAGEEAIDGSLTVVERRREAKLVSISLPSSADPAPKLDLRRRFETRVRPPSHRRGTHSWCPVWRSGFLMERHPWTTFPTAVDAAVVLHVIAAQDEPARRRDPARVDSVFCDVTPKARAPTTASSAIVRIRRDVSLRPPFSYTTANEARDTNACYMP